MHYARKNDIICLNLWDILQRFYGDISTVGN